MESITDKVLEEVKKAGNKGVCLHDLVDSTGEDSGSVSTVLHKFSETGDLIRANKASCRMNDKKHTFYVWRTHTEDLNNDPQKSESSCMGSEKLLEKSEYKLLPLTGRIVIMVYGDCGNMAKKVIQ